MPDIEQMMRTLKLGGLAKDWRSVDYHDTEQYVIDLWSRPQDSMS